MNDEIKEILDDLDYCIARKRGTITLNHKDCELLLDYITNLQQDLEKANDIIAKDRQFYKSRMDEYVELKKENERLKETNVYCNRTDCSGRPKDSRKYDSVYQEKEDYKSRVEKASELLQKHGNGTFDDNLLNILQNGSEK